MFELFSKNKIFLPLLLIGTLLTGIVIYYIFSKTSSNSTIGPVTIEDLMVLGEGEKCSGGMRTQKMIIEGRIKICKSGYYCGGGSTAIDGPGFCVKDGSGK